MNLDVVELDRCNLVKIKSVCEHVSWSSQINQINLRAPLTAVSGKFLLQLHSQRSKLDKAVIHMSLLINPRCFFVFMHVTMIPRMKNSRREKMLFFKPSKC